ncbi:hypothetical protein conserved [Entamoeba histolytica]|uniref:Ribosome quality control complex subunit 2 n=6 Tax=Entamoeba histolytica TaxID=5759 RepID=C4M7C7_ENTH1|nr:hypothetical protein, conserved [Entamoeba histolytica HM-1:IMSS]EAL44894.1 hypothetical protein, conserved [Entamoeba histolytica HM-1:IMSS]EMD45123.1 zinc knuckle domain containing protein [Entamoeba histolytica KU27]ENY63435.1 zinc knuckle domain containing protein [Entamoeba histolytica HM-1:IMSS-A]GAT97429.1 hypothetical protein conserved [Entamoeba histolytica]|eukprot:XP_650274.1 hypothetical protein, conserved [Entamoeba histolytica HM-1:IMSS]
MSQFSKKPRKWMSPLEIKAIVGEMNNKLQNFNINTVYDVNRRLYVIKLSKTDCKEFIVIESGVRVHLTEYNREKSDFPNNFTSRLRKYLNKKKLIKINQIGNDRVIELVFGNATERYSLIVDLYSNGNICLCDQEYKILLILRSFTFDKTGDKVAVGEKYPLHLLSDANGIDELKKIIKEYDTIFTSESMKGWTLKQLINYTSDFGQQLSDHCCSQFGKESSKTKRLEEFNEEEKSLMKKILEEAITRYEKIDSGKCKGYIFYHETNKKKYYEEVSCDIFYQDSKRKYIEFESFEKAMDEFHSHIEKQEYEAEVEKKEMIMKKKIQAVIDGHQKRYQGLLDKAETLKNEAEAVEENIQVVDQLIQEINVFLKEKMKWEQIEGIIESLKENDPTSIAKYIKRFDFKNEVVVLELKHTNEDKIIEVEIALNKNGFENIRNFYEMRKNILAKAEKTMESKDLAIKQAENKQERVAKEKKITLVDVKKMRKRFWFEKFHWFLSSENFIIISGKDALQNDVIYRRYMKSTDVYVHADIHGAASCIIKGIPGKTIGAPTLEQAGKIAVCRSSAWTSKIVTSAWWVYSDQVSKTAPSGEYLTTGSFMIRGKKNYLPPVPLVFGIGIMFAVEKEDKENHEEIIPQETKEVQQKENMESVIKIVEQEGDKEQKKEKQEVVPVQVEKVKVKNLEVKEKDEGKVTIEEIQFKKVEFSSKKEEEEARLQQKIEKKKRTEKRKEIEDKKKKDEEEKKKNKPVRGKAGKMKKLKRYEDQDEEDRKKMEERIGHKFNVKEEEQPKEDIKKVVPIQCFFCGSTEHLAKDCPKRKEELKKKQEEKIKERMEEEEEIDDEEMSVNDTIFVGELVEGMNVKFAVPVCGPYDCVSKYKYHIKLTPGNTKAGKAIKNIIGLWSTWKDQKEIEKVLISGISTDEYIGVMMSDVTVHQPNGKIKTQKWKGGSNKEKKSKGKK